MSEIENAGIRSWLGWFSGRAEPSSVESSAALSRYQVDHRCSIRKRRPHQTWSAERLSQVHTPASRSGPDHLWAAWQSETAYTPSKIGSGSSCITHASSVPKRTAPDFSWAANCGFFQKQFRWFRFRRCKRSVSKVVLASSRATCRLHPAIRTCSSRWKTPLDSDSGTLCGCLHSWVSKSRCQSLSSLARSPWHQKEFSVHRGLAIQSRRFQVRNTLCSLWLGGPGHLLQPQMPTVYFSI